MNRFRTALVSLLALVVSAPALAQTSYNRFGPANGVLKGATTTWQTTSANSSDIFGLWSGTCDATTYLRGDGSCQTPPGTGGGTVDEVDFTAPSVFSVAGAPITSNGTIALDWATGQTQNRVLASPDGMSGAISLRALLAADLPATSLYTTSTPTLSNAWTFSTLPNLYPTSALETAASVTPTRSYSYNDPRRASAFYQSAGWTDYGATAAYVDATHYTYAGDWTGIFKSGMRVRIVGASTAGSALLMAAAYSAPNTTLTIANDTGDTLTSTPLAIWLQTGLPANDWANLWFARNAIGGMQIFNYSQGSSAAARYCASTRNVSNVSDSAVCMVAVSPNYSGAYLGGGFTSGGRSVLYTPPSFSMEIGTSDQARIKIDSGGLITLTQPSSTGSPALTVNGALSTFEIARFVGSGASNQFVNVTNGAGVGAFIALAGNGATFATNDFVFGQNGSDSRALIINRANTDMAFSVNSTTALTIDNDTGVYTNGATGASKGAGTINATALYVNGVAVASSSTGVVRSSANKITSTNVTTNCTVSSTEGSGTTFGGIASCSRSGTGVYTFVFAGIGSVVTNPVCTVNATSSGTIRVGIVEFSTPSAGSVATFSVVASPIAADSTSMYVTCVYNVT